jgi:hypothetical protein
VLGASKLQGVTLTKGAAGAGKLVVIKELEAEGLAATKHGIIAAELEATTTGIGKAGAAAKAGIGKAGAAAGKATLAKGTAGAAGLPAAKCLGAGIGWGIGSVAPFLVLGALGIGALGVYLYRRNRKFKVEESDFDDEEIGAPAL